MELSSNAINLKIKNTVGENVIVYIVDENEVNIGSPINLNKDKSTTKKIIFDTSSRKLIIRWYKKTGDILGENCGTCTINAKIPKEGSDLDAIRAQCKEYEKLDIDNSNDTTELNSWKLEIGDFIERTASELKQINKYDSMVSIKTKIENRIATINSQISQTDNINTQLILNSENEYTLYIGHSTINEEIVLDGDTLKLIIENSRDNWVINIIDSEGNKYEEKELQGKGTFSQEFKIDEQSFIQIMWHIKGLSESYSCYINLKRPSGLTPFDEAELYSIITVLKKYMKWYEDKEYDKIDNIEDLKNKGNEIRAEKTSKDENSLSGAEKITKYRDILIQQRTRYKHIRQMY